MWNKSSAAFFSLIIWLCIVYQNSYSIIIIFFRIQRPAWMQAFKVQNEWGKHGLFLSKWVTGNSCFISQFSLVSLTCSGWEGEGICNTSKDRDLLKFSTHVSLEQWKSLLRESYFSPVEGELALIKTVFFLPVATTIKYKTVLLNITENKLREGIVCNVLSYKRTHLLVRCFLGEQQSNAACLQLP